MPISTSVCTKVFQFPQDSGDRKAFLQDLESLAAQYNVSVIAGSVHNEISYVEVLEKSLSDEIGDFQLEDIRQEFERSSNS